MAELNRKRGRGKGRAASVSLAVAVVLLMTAGSFSSYLGLSADLAATGSDCDIEVVVGGSRSASANEALYGRFCGVEGVEGRGWSAVASVMAEVPDGMAGSAFGQDVGDMGLHYADVAGGYALYSTLYAVSDSLFADYAAQELIDTSRFEGAFAGGADDPIPAIAVRAVSGNTGEQYGYAEVFAGCGPLDVAYSCAGDAFGGFALDEHDEVVGYVESADTGAVEPVPFDQLDTKCVSIDVVALADRLPGALGSVPMTGAIIVPYSAIASDSEILGNVEGMHDSESSGSAAADSHAVSVFNGNFRCYFDAQDHGKAADDLYAVAAECARGEGVGVMDFAGEQEASRGLSKAIDVFTLSFTAILTLIAISNVFNTVANGLILRRREFAVLKSVGMGESDFRKMILCECLGYGIRGLAPGVVISVAVSLLLFFAMRAAFTGLAYVFPWGHLAIAVAMVAAAMFASAAYGLHRCKTDSIIEALRDGTD